VKAEASFLPPFIPLRSLARWATGLLLATLVMAWIAVGVDLASLRLLVRAAGGTQIGVAARDAQLQTNAILLGAQLTLLAATGTAFLIWLFQARVNLRALGVRRLRFSRQWTVASFLIPPLNAFRPYQVTREIWQASDPGNLDAFNWRSLSVPPLLMLWWGSFVAYGALELLAFLSDLGAGLSLAKLQLSTALTILADTTAAVSACLACFVVERISAAQQQKWERQRAHKEEADSA
jgi:hypothetical protein